MREPIILHLQPPLDRKHCDRCARIDALDEAEKAPGSVVAVKHTPRMHWRHAGLLHCEVCEPFRVEPEPQESASDRGAVDATAETLPIATVGADTNPAAARDAMARAFRNACDSWGGPQPVNGFHRAMASQLLVELAAQGFEVRQVQS